MNIKLKRVYDSPTKEDGKRYLVERLWPRGIKKDNLPMDGWLKELAPTSDLRKWFSHDPTKWEQFKNKYFAELDSNSKNLEALIHTLRKGTVTLLYSSKDQEHNNAVALKKYLERKKKHE